MRSTLIAREYAQEKGFRWRGEQVSRIEGFSDAVFGFAITLLVVSLEVPKTAAELLTTMRGFFAFGVCFAILFGMWRAHYVFFRRFGLEDRVVSVLNGVLLFVVLFFVYPLKFMFTYLADVLLYLLHAVPESTRDAVRQSLNAMVTEADARPIMLVYGAGYLAVSLVFASLYVHAYRSRGSLELDAIELHATRDSMQEHLIQAGIAVVSMAFAYAGHPEVAGFSYFAIGPVLGVHGMWMGRKRRKLEESLASAR
jgi:uncharacterized membrane protein